ncbi:four-carbon acid sugar kinase family protein, partial [Acinetobacter baumannii]
ELRPVGETEFARDATFGYRSSDLAAWVEEKSLGRHRAEDVIVLDLAVIRSGTAAIADAIQDAAHRTPIVCDAVTEDDLRLLSLGVIEARRR